MGAARDKLREIELEINCVYGELRATKQDLDKARNETRAAEDNYSRVCSRNMCLTRNTDIANLLMMFSSALFIVTLCILVYVL